MLLGARLRSTPWQEFNKGIFDYLIATDDPANREEHAELARARCSQSRRLPTQKGKKRKGSEAMQQQQQRKRAKSRRKMGSLESYEALTSRACAL